MKKSYVIQQRSFFFGLLLCFGQAVMAQVQLSPIEAKIGKAIDEQWSATLSLLQRSVNINSGTYHIEGVRAVGDIYAKELRALGFTVEWVGLPDSMQRAGHLVAYRTGTKGKKLFLIGHLDTVFEPDMPPNPFTKLNDSTATGQGINDMKGGDVMIIAALKALHQQNLLDNTTITVYMTGDEENAGYPREIARGDFIARAKQHDIALAFETAAGMNTIATARRGASGWRLEVEGKQAHSSGVFGSAGYGSIYEAARIINSFRERLGQEQYLTFNPGLIVGGSEVSYSEEAQQGTVSGKTNIISPRTYANGDLRFISEQQKENARTIMREIVAQSLPGTKATIGFVDGIPSMPPTDGNTQLAARLSDVSVALGYGKVNPGNPGSRGAGDISYVAQYLDCLDGLGASGRGAHAPGETINLYEYPKLTKRAAVFIYRLTR
jgi:glutamate carboxypeptidase